jgi:hypothetical protein
MLLLLVILTVASAMAQKPLIYIKVPQCETIEFRVDELPGDRYTWDIYRDSTVNFAQENGDVEPVPYFEDGMYEGSTVRVNGLDPGRYFVRVMVWDEVNCTNNLLMYLVDIYADPPTAELTGDSLCVGDPAMVRIVLTGRGPWNLITYTYVSNGNEGNAVEVNIEGWLEDEYTASIPGLPVGITEIWVKQIIDECTENLIPSDRARIVIYPKPGQSKIYPVEK